MVNVSPQAFSSLLQVLLPFIVRFMIINIVQVQIGQIFCPSFVSSCFLDKTLFTFSLNKPCDSCVHKFWGVCCPPPPYCLCLQPEAKSVLEDRKRKKSGESQMDRETENKRSEQEQKLEQTLKPQTPEVSSKKGKAVFLCDNPTNEEHQVLFISVSLTFEIQST